MPRMLSGIRAQVCCRLFRADQIFKKFKKKISSDFSDKSYTKIDPEFVAFLESRGINLDDYRGSSLGMKRDFIMLFEQRGRIYPIYTSALL
jgi:hypothetical protein